MFRSFITKQIKFYKNLIKALKQITDKSTSSKKGVSRNIEITSAFENKQKKLNEYIEAKETELNNFENLNEKNFWKQFNPKFKEKIICNELRYEKYKFKDFMKTQNNEQFSFIQKLIGNLKKDLLDSNLKLKLFDKDEKDVEDFYNNPNDDDLTTRISNDDDLPLEEEDEE
jgi:hypothetical protein